MVTFVDKNNTTTNQQYTKIKICGIRRMKDIECVNYYKPDYIGYVFANTRRKVTDSEAARMTTFLHPDIIPIGVFVNEPIRHIISLCDENIIQGIQLHGDEDISYVKQLRDRTNKPIIKALRVQSTAQLLQYQNFPSDYLLLDTYVKDSYGGTGKSFDRSMIPENYRPFFLAGGLNENNIIPAARECHPYCIDLSSAVETDGYKDPDKIKAVMDKMKQLNTA